VTGGYLCNYSYIETCYGLFKVRYVTISE
jgi:hypothetical protein